MAEQSESQLEEMNAAIRAQRERQAAPKSIISTEDVRPPEPEPAAEPAPGPPRRGLLARLLGR
ncbi:MAG TPA: hypothetical protein VHD91_10080 [Gaiellaceae bacterium]|nr:hypothetical protein [Gaiellaceae bacterium]